MRINKTISEIIICIAEFLVGLLLLTNPVGFTSIIFMGIGVLLIITGIAAVLDYFRTNPEMAALEQNFARGVGEILLGCFCLFRYQWFLVTFPVLTVLYGLATMVTGIMKLQWTVDLLRMKRKNWIISMISAVITLICAVVIVTNPFSSTAILWIFAGTVLIVEAVFDLLSLVWGRRQRTVE